jgi:exopolysaccharide/PEP-CTERM locus tyrosine autokinase
MSIFEQALLKRNTTRTESVQDGSHPMPDDAASETNEVSTLPTGARRGPPSGVTSERPGHPIREILREARMLVPDAFDAKLADEYRRIKRPLLDNAFGKGAELMEHGNLIQVTSSLSGEGKTYTALNLAVSIALEQEKTVLLVDCDVIKQDLSCLLGLADRPGLLEVLDSGLDLSEVLVATDVPDLVVLPAGTRHAYVSEVLSSNRMAALTREMASRYPDRIILFDSPPLLATPMTQIVAGLVGQVTMVVEADTTPQDKVQDALGLIGENKAIGLVLNKAGHATKRYSSTYYYGDYYAP